MRSAGSTGSSEPRRGLSREVALLTAFLTAGTLVQGLLSRGFGLTLACMVNSTAYRTHTESQTQNVSKCGHLLEINHDADLGYTGSYLWDSIQQANVVAVYSWGSIVVLPFSGFLIEILDARQTVAVALTIIGISMGIFPVVTKAGGYAGAIVIRLFMGFSYAVISPSMDQLVATYTPWDRRNILYAIITAGSYVSAIIGNSLGGLLCASTIFGGWPAIYYITAMAAGVWLISWEFYVLIVPRISAWRAKAVPYEPPQVVAPAPEIKKKSHSRPKTRVIMAYARQFWRDVGHRWALWAMLPSVFASTCTTSLLINYIPTFYRDVLQISLKSNGFYSSLPFVAIILGSFFFSSIADYLKRGYAGSTESLFRSKKLWISPDWVSKIMNTIGFVGSGVFIVLVTFIPCLPPAAAIALLTIGAVAIRRERCPRLYCTALDCQLFLDKKNCLRCKCPKETPSKGCDDMPTGTMREMIFKGCPNETNPHIHEGTPQICRSVAERRFYTGIFPGYRVGIVTLCPKWTAVISSISTLTSVIANIIFPYIQGTFIAAVISSISTLTSVIANIIFPYIQGAIVSHGQESEWHTLFVVLVIVDVVAASIFLLFGSVTPIDAAPWTSLTMDVHSMSPPPSEVGVMTDATDEKTPLLSKS